MLKACGKCGKIHDYNFKCNKGKQYKKNDIDKMRSKYAWTKKAEEIKQESNYLCAICLQEGIYNYKELETHHIIKLQDDPSGLLDNYNLLCVCKKCHKKCDDGEIPIEYQLELARKREDE